MPRRLAFSWPWQEALPFLLTQQKRTLAHLLQIDACWNIYLDVLASDREERFADSIQAWIVLQYALDSCAAAPSAASTCTDWAFLEPLETPYMLDQLCSSSCDWDLMSRPASLWINATLPSAPRKDVICAKRADNFFCAAAVFADAQACDLIRNGCAEYYREHLASTLGASVASAQYSLEVAACTQELQSAPWGAHAKMSLLPPTVVLRPIGRASRMEINALVEASLPGGGGSSSSSSSSSRREGGAYFSRIEYNVTIHDQTLLVSGLMAEPVDNAPARGIALFFHGSKAPGDLAISDLAGPTTTIIRVREVVAIDLAQADADVSTARLRDPDPYFIIDGAGTHTYQSRVIFNQVGRPGGLSTNANRNQRPRWQSTFTLTAPTNSGPMATFNLTLLDRDNNAEGGGGFGVTNDDLLGSGLISIDLTQAAEQMVDIVLSGVPVDNDGGNGGVPRNSMVRLFLTVESPIGDCMSASSCSTFGLDLTRQQEHVLVATFTQLGYVVLAPDDLGLGVSEPPVANQGYMMRDIVSAVALEMLRGAQQHLLAKPGRFRSGRMPELYMMGGSHGGFITAAMQRRLQDETALWRFVTTGSFMDAAPIDVSGAMMTLFAADQQYSNPWYLVMVGKSMSSYLPNQMPNFEPYIVPAFIPAYTSPMTSDELNQLYRDHGNSIPLDAFNATYQAIMRDPTSDVRVMWSTLFSEHSDLHIGWQPRAPLQHLCSAADDEQVPSSISVSAGAGWNISVILVNGSDPQWGLHPGFVGHTTGIAMCLLQALRNITAAAQPPTSLHSSNSLGSMPIVTPYSLETPFFTWNRVDIAFYCLSGAASFWFCAYLAVLMQTPYVKEKLAKWQDEMEARRIPTPRRIVRSISPSQMVEVLSPTNLLRILSPSNLTLSPSSKRREQEEEKKPEEDVLELSALGRKALPAVKRSRNQSVAFVTAVAGDIAKTTRLYDLATRLLNTLLSCPCTILIVVLIAVLAPTGAQINKVLNDVAAGKEIFALDINSLRSVSGTLTDRQDAYAIFSGIGAPSMLTIMAAAPPRPPPAQPMPPHPPAPPAQPPAPRCPPPAPPTTPSPVQPSSPISSRRLSPQSEPRDTVVSSVVTLGNVMALLSPLFASSRQLQEGGGQARIINFYYTLNGGRRYEPDRMQGNVLQADVLARIRNAERRAIDIVGDHLVSWKTVVPCFLGEVEGGTAPEPRGELPNDTPTTETIQQCLSHIATTTGDTLAAYEERMASDFMSTFFGDEVDQCAGIRSQIEVSMDADFDTLIREFTDLSDSVVEVTFGGDAWMTFRELYLNLQDDVLYVIVSICAIQAFLVVVLRMPIFGTFALLVILLCFPVTIALYLGAVGQEQLPILAVVSLYLVLGIGADAVFIFTNTYALSEQESQKRKELRPSIAVESASPTRNRAHRAIRGCFPWCFANSTLAPTTPPASRTVEHRMFTSDLSFPSLFFPHFVCSHPHPPQPSAQPTGGSICHAATTATARSTCLHRP